MNVDKAFICCLYDVQDILRASQPVFTCSMSTMGTREQCDICLKVTIKITEVDVVNDVFTVMIKLISLIGLAFPWLTLSK